MNTAKPKSESQLQEESSCKLHQLQPFSPSPGQLLGLGESIWSLSGPWGCHTSKAPSVSSRGNGKYAQLQVGSQGDGERGNQLMDTAPRAGSSFRAFGKTGEKKPPKHLRNKEGLIPPLPLRKIKDCEPHTADMEFLLGKLQRKAVREFCEVGRAQRAQGARTRQSVLG